MLATQRAFAWLAGFLHIKRVGGRRWDAIKTGGVFIPVPKGNPAPPERVYPRAVRRAAFRKAGVAWRPVAYVR